MNYRLKGRKIDWGRSAAKFVDTATGRASQSFYDPKSGLFLMLVLALVLWWIIPLGQMVAGYVGGRRAGSMSKGVGVALGATFILSLLGLAITAGTEWILSLQNVQDFIANTMPPLGDWLASARDYMAGFAGMVSGSFAFSGGDFMMMGVFAVVGGAMANQSRKEISIIVEQAVNGTAPAPPRSAKAATEGRPMGFSSYADYTAVSVNNVAGAELRAQGQEKEIPVSRTRRRNDVTATSIASTAVPSAAVTATSSATTSETLPLAQFVGDAVETPVEEPKPARARRSRAKEPAKEEGNVETETPAAEPERAPVAESTPEPAPAEAPVAEKEEKVLEPALAKMPEPEKTQPPVQHDHADDFEYL